MKTIEKITKLMEENHAAMKEGKLSQGKASVMSRDYATAAKMHADKLVHDKQYNICEPQNFYGSGN